MVNNIPIVIVAAVGKNTKAIGRKNDLLWHAPEDMKRFKTLTTGKPIIMGRKTFESILKILDKPLPGRLNIVVTRQANYFVPEGVLVTSTLEKAFAEAVRENPKEIHIGGGSELYKQSLPYVDKIFITWFDSDMPGDTFFPDFEEYFAVTKVYPPQQHEGLEYQWIDYARKESTQQ